MKYLESYFSSQHGLFNALEPAAQRIIEEQALAAQGHTVPEHVSLKQLFHHRMWVVAIY